jgi:hypothetical protein
MPNLRIRISGLCFFAFNRPLKTSREDPTSARLLLQRLTSARTLKHMVLGRNEVLDQHFPMLEFSLGDRDATSTRRVDFSARPDANGRMTRGVCLLFGDDVTITTDDGGVAPTLQLDRSKPEDPAALQLSQQEQGSLWWMPTLEDAFPGNSAINPLFANNPPAANQPILARVELNQGKLQTLELSDYPCTFVSPGSASFNQRIATALALDIPFKRRIIFDMVRRIDGQQETSRLVLRPSDGGDLDVEIKNMEIDDLIGIRKNYSARLEADFEIYADLLLNPLQAGPTYLRQITPGNPAGVGLSNCPPGGG